MKIRMKDVEFRYGSFPALKDTCLEVERSEIVACLGPNGAGKSTLIKCIDRILRPRNGSIAVDDKDLKVLSHLQIARQIGYVPQGARYAFPAPVFESVLMGRRPHITWRATERDMEKVAEVIEMLDLEDLSMRDINQLSGGQQQRVFIARALAQEPAILLLDEPTSNLDIRVQLEVWEIIRKIVRSHSMTAIAAMHDLNLAARYSDRIAMMKDGRVFAVGKPKEVLTSENIRSVYDVEAEVIERNGSLYVLPLEPVKNRARDWKRKLT